MFAHCQTHRVELWMCHKQIHADIVRDVGVDQTKTLSLIHERISIIVRDKD